MKKILLLSGLLLSFNSQAGIEITPFTGLKTSGEFQEFTTGTRLNVDDSSSYGFVIDSDYDHDGQIQFLYSKQSSPLRAGQVVPSDILFDVDIEYFHIGGLILDPVNAKMNSYIGAGLGLTHFSPSVPNYSSNSELSLSLSGGIKHNFSKHIGMRVGVTFYGTSVNKNTSIFCNNGSCNIHFKSNLFTQFEAQAGIILRF